MRTSAIRRATLADGLILIAAVAAGLAIARTQQGFYPRETWPPGTEPVLRLTLIWLYWPAVMVMVALIPLRLRPPRPPMRRVRRQPGFIACAAVAYAMIHCSLCFAIDMFKLRLTLRDVIFLPPDLPGGVIVTAWLVLALSGRWQPEPSWIDRSGRLLGFAWVTVYIINQLFRALS